MSTRATIRGYVRDYMYEATADLFSDSLINNSILHALRELPRRGIYLEELWTTSMVVDQLDYTLPTGTLKVEKLEVNEGTASKPDWVEQKGWDTYGGAIYLPTRPNTTDTMRIHLKKKFTDLTDDVSATDVPDDMLELVSWGAVVRCYKSLMGYLVDAKNWDAVAKPDGITMRQLTSWIRDAQSDYEQLIKQFRTQPRPRQIDMVG